MHPTPLISCPSTASLHSVTSPSLQKKINIKLKIKKNLTNLSGQCIVHILPQLPQLSSLTFCRACATQLPICHTAPVHTVHHGHWGLRCVNHTYSCAPNTFTCRCWSPWVVSLVPGLLFLLHHQHCTLTETSHRYPSVAHSQRSRSYGSSRLVSFMCSRSM